MTQSFPEYESPSLLFVRLTMADCHDVLRLFSDEETMHFDGGYQMQTMDEAAWLIRQYSSWPPNQPAVRWAVKSKSDRSFLGTAGFHKINHQAKKAEVGGELLKDYWRKGYGKEGLNALLSIGFNNFNFNRITAMAASDNRSAVGLLDNSPLIKEGVLKEWEFWNGKFEDMNVYRLLKKEWQAAGNIMQQ